VTFGLLDFDEREQQVTDGSHDGGIDAYHIDEKSKTVFCVQGKFAHNAANFQNKQISVDDLVKVQLRRILRAKLGAATSLLRFFFTRPFWAIFGIAICSLFAYSIENPNKCFVICLTKLQGGASPKPLILQSTYMLMS
jgi:hypothetical protein